MWSPVHLEHIALNRYRSALLLAAATALTVLAFVALGAPVVVTCWFPTLMYPLLMRWSPRLVGAMVPVHCACHILLVGFRGSGFDALHVHQIYYAMLGVSLGCSQLVVVVSSVCSFTAGIVLYLLQTNALYIFPRIATAASLRSSAIAVWPLSLVMMIALGVFNDGCRMAVFGRLHDTVTALEQSAIQLDKKRRSADAFAAHVSFDVRTPLSVLLAIADTLMRAENLKPSTRRAITNVDTAGSMLLNLLSNVLDAQQIVRAGSGSLLLQEAPVCLRRTILRVASMMTLSAAASVHIRIAVGRHVPAIVLGDEARLEQVLVNLLTNACKFTQSGHVLLRVLASDDTADNTPAKEVTADWVASPADLLADVAPGGDRTAALLFDVEDTGPGLTKEQQDGLFKRYGAGVSAATRHRSGAGLGTAVGGGDVRACCA
jgi:signal transduction histidine kinase